MIILRKEFIWDKPARPELNVSKVVEVKLIKKDTGVSFADLAGECEIEGHVTSKYTKHKFNEYVKSYTDWVERCEVCEMERDIREYNSYTSKTLSDNLISNYHKKPTEYGKWRPSPCYECEENCIISRPLNDDFNCPSCGKWKTASGIFHSNGDSVLLFNCGVCLKIDQVIE